MDKLWKQIVVAITIGLMVPQMVFTAVYRLRADTITEESKPVTEPTEQTEVLTEKEEVTNGVLYVPVVCDGKVQIMDLEKYICGVVLAEMPAYFEEEALKAQAVAARTYTMRRLTLGDKHPQGAVCTDPGCCQAYLTEEQYLLERGSRSDMQKIYAAVKATTGEVVTYDGELIEATYFSCSGGRTEDAVAVWGEEIPYLQSVDSPGETKAEQYQGRVYLTAAQFQRLLGRTLSGSPKSWIGEVAYTEGGGVDHMVIGGITYSGTQLRKLLELSSTVFTMSAADSGITIVTKGWGHRVGMSQYGADAMASAGNSYQQILAHYYQGTIIDKLWNLG